MTRYALLISADANSAYFAETLKVAQAELAFVTGIEHSEVRQFGSMQFLQIEAASDSLPLIARLSFVHGVFEVSGETLLPVDLGGDYQLPADFVFANKYKGKTNERLTQLLLNLGLAASVQIPGQIPKVLDPMCGRGTSLFWALSYGLNAKGIEQDAKALADMRMQIKKWTKLHRVKHKLSEGHILPSGKGGKTKSDKGKYLEFAINDVSLRAVTGDAREAESLHKNQKVDIILSDLPYGVQHFSSDNTRNPLAVVKQALPAWKAMLKKTGVLVLAYNSYIPTREDMTAALVDAGFKVLEQDFSHRMSESIVRDIIIAKP